MIKKNKMKIDWNNRYWVNPKKKHRKNPHTINNDVGVTAKLHMNVK